MKTIVIVVALFGFVLSEQVSTPPSEDKEGTLLPDITNAVSEGISKIGDAVSSAAEIEVKESDINYWFFSPDNPKDGVLVNQTNTTCFNRSRRIMLIIHGWNNNNESEFPITVREAAVKCHNINVIVVDWSLIAKKNYLTAKESVQKVGEYVAKLISNELVSKWGFSLSNIIVVGHSLGAHVAGCAGAALNGELGLIFGLDPAGPLFTVSDTHNRLDPSDAKYVQVIHTNAGDKGIATSIGHIDFYPNGGRKQEGCSLDPLGICHHSRSYSYFAESLCPNGTLFVAVACSSYEAYHKGECVSNRTCNMGTLDVDISARGDFYLDTNSEYPYAMG